MLIFTTPAVVLILALAACGAEQAETGSSTAQSTGVPSSQPPSGSPTTVQPGGSVGGGDNDKLTIKVQASTKAPAKSVTLTCEPAGGSHPDAAAACRTLTAAQAPFKKPPKPQICTKIYGGPQVATVQGTWRGETVKAKFTRSDGCELNRWQRMGPVLEKLLPAA